MQGDGIMRAEIKLVNSGVTFTASPHGYSKDGKEYSGITGLIHAVKRLGVYPDAGDYVKNFVIPKAGEYGTSVHEAIEHYETFGEKDVLYNMSFGSHDVSGELDSYIRLKEKSGCENIASEYNVAYGDYASNIDNVWMKDCGIYLVDTKTNNLGYYPGGKEGLKEYLMWQLNCYRFMFEHQNPSLKVKGLLANWIRKDEAETWDIPMLPDADVEDLLSTKYDIMDFLDCRFQYYRLVDGEKVYYDEEDKPILKNDEALIVPAEMIVQICEMERMYKDMKAQYDGMVKTIQEAMTKHGVKSWGCDAFKATIIPASTSQTFDKDKYIKDNPDVDFTPYMKTVNKKESIRITYR